MANQTPTSKVLARPFRLVASVLIAIIVAGLLFAQAGSSVLMRQQPEISTQMMPFNGLALEQLASRQFFARIVEPADIVPAAIATRGSALRAFAYDPLSPKAHAIIAIAEKDPAKKSAILAEALKMNRRDLLLQGTILDGYINRRDYAGTLEVLDTILRVHPEQKNTFFPTLKEALKDEAALPELTTILDRSSSWHDEFLTYAATDQEVLTSLAKLRFGRVAVDAEVDRRLIVGLVESGQLDLASQLYLKAKPASSANLQSRGTLTWDSDFPPFDWQLASESGFRADPSRDGQSLEVFVRGGKGGVVAQRSFPTNGLPFMIELDHSLELSSEMESAHLRVFCLGSDTAVFDVPLQASRKRYFVPATTCKFVQIALNVRARSGRPPIRGDIERITISKK